MNDSRRAGRPLAAHVRAAVDRGAAAQPRLAGAGRSGAIQRALSPEQQQVIHQGNVHRQPYDVRPDQIQPVKQIYQGWHGQVPSYQQFESATSVFFALRSSDPALVQIDTLLKKFHASSDEDQVAAAKHLLLACNFWLRKANVVPTGSRPLDFAHQGNLPGGAKLSVEEKRRSGIVALSTALDGWLLANKQGGSLAAVVDGMARPNRGVTPDHGNIDVLKWNQKHATRLPSATATAEQRAGFDADPDNRLLSLDDDSQKRVAKLVFRNGRAYRWRYFLRDDGFAPFHTGPGGVHYVMDKRGRIYAGTLIDGPNFVHASLVGYADALSAGFIVATGGQVTKIKNDSGHYHPRAQEMVNMLLRLQLYGVNLANVQVERMHGTHPKGNATFSAADMLAAAHGEWPDEWEGLEALF